MELRVLEQIRSNPYITRYLQENSYWYKYLNRNPESIVELDKQVKEHYRLTTKDKMEDFGKKIALIRNFIEVLR